MPLLVFFPHIMVNKVSFKSEQCKIQFTFRASRMVVFPCDIRLAAVQTISPREPTGTDCLQVWKSPTTEHRTTICIQQTNAALQRCSSGSRWVLLMLQH